MAGAIVEVCGRPHEQPAVDHDPDTVIMWPLADIAAYFAQPKHRQAIDEVRSAETRSTTSWGVPLWVARTCAAWITTQRTQVVGPAQYAHDLRALLAAVEGPPGGTNAERLERATHYAVGIAAVRSEQVSMTIASFTPEAGVDRIVEFSGPVSSGMIATFADYTEKQNTE